MQVESDLDSPTTPVSGKRNGRMLNVTDYRSIYELCPCEHLSLLSAEGSRGCWPIKYQIIEVWLTFNKTKSSDLTQTHLLIQTIWIKYSVVDLYFCLYICLPYSYHMSSNRSGSSWLHVTPWSMRRMLNWIRIKYNNPPVFITENGVSDKNGTVDDDHRVYYIREYCNFMLKGRCISISMNRHAKL